MPRSLTTKLTEALMKKRIVFLVNPKSGKFHSLRPLEAIRAVFSEPELSFRYHPVIIFVSDGPEIYGAAAEFAGDSQTKLLVATGGDGTVGTVAAALCRQLLFLKVHSLNLLPPPLGILPIGTGNDFAQGIGYTGNLVQDIKLMLTSPICCIDTGSVNNNFFLNAAGIGFDAAVIEELQKNSSWFPGGLKYTWTALKLLPRRLSWEFLLREGLTAAKDNFLLVAVTNGPQYGAGMKIAPKADISDGKLDVCAIRPVSIPKQLKLLSKVFAGTHGDMPAVSFSQTEYLIIESEKPFPLQADGELLGSVTRAEFKVAPSSLLIAAPSKRGEK